MSLSQAIDVISSLTDDNLIINGDFRIWQRGSTFTLTSSKYTADRWVYEILGMTNSVTVTYDLDVPTPSTDLLESADEGAYSLKVSNNGVSMEPGAGGYSFLCYRVEGFDVKPILSAQGATLSFWVKSSKTGSYCVSFRNNPCDRSYIVNYTINTANTWEKKKVYVSIPSITTIGGVWNTAGAVGFRIGFALTRSATYITGSSDAWIDGNAVNNVDQVNWHDNASAVFRIAQVKLEPGNVATRFIARDYADELERCQRYYETMIRTHKVTMATGTYRFYNWNSFNVEKRATPSVDWASLKLYHPTSSWYTCTSYAVAGINKVGVIVWGDIPTNPATIFDSGLQEIQCYINAEL